MKNKIIKHKDKILIGIFVLIILLSTLYIIYTNFAMMANNPEFDLKSGVEIINRNFNK